MGMAWGGIPPRSWRHRSWYSHVHFDRRPPHHSRPVPLAHMEGHDGVALAIRYPLLFQVARPESSHHHRSGSVTGVRSRTAAKL